MAGSISVKILQEFRASNYLIMKNVPGHPCIPLVDNKNFFASLEPQKIKFISLPSLAYNSNSLDKSGSI